MLSFLEATFISGYSSLITFKVNERFSYSFRFLFLYILPISRFLRYLNKTFPKKIKGVTENILSNDTRNYLVKFYSKDKKILETILGKKNTNWT